MATSRDFNENFKREDPSELARIKRCHVRLNRDSLDRAMKKQEEKMEKTFLGEKIVEGVGPWRRVLEAGYDV
ncbi:MAG: hypothetical protein NTU79_11545 [Planctomycetota bacterium]|jgi:hypothetical protein|nr:hypothetical protein [Planctomycetota bacterium]